MKGTHWTYMHYKKYISHIKFYYLNIVIDSQYTSSNCFLLFVLNIFIKGIKKNKSKKKFCDSFNFCNQIITILMIVIQSLQLFSMTIYLQGYKIRKKKVDYQLKVVLYTPFQIFISNERTHFCRFYTTTKKMIGQI